MERKTNKLKVGLRRVLIVGLFALGGVFSFAGEGSTEVQVVLYAHPYNPTTGLGERPRTPIHPLMATLDDHTLYINGVHSGYTLYLIDDSGEEPDVVYQVVIPTGVNTVVLPAYLSGTYELQLYNGGAFYFYTFINI